MAGVCRAGASSFSSCSTLSSASTLEALISSSYPPPRVGLVVGRRGIGSLTVSAGLFGADAVGGDLTFAVASGGALAALAGAAFLTDPQKRREKQAETVGGNEKEYVRNYFNNQGFERWRKIYGETDDVNTVQLDIRVGHAETVKKTLAFLGGGDGLQGITVCDAGCGTGSLTIPMVLSGAEVTASDISSSMVDEASRRTAIAIAEKQLEEGQTSLKLQEPKFQAQDLESIAGKYHTVVCLDVLIHYPQEKAGAMISHLASRAEKRLLLSFAPKTLFYTVLKRIGELFPGPSKATRAYLHSEEDVEKVLNELGWKVTRRDTTATKFYFSTLMEAVPASSS